MVTRHRAKNDTESATHTVYVIEDGNVPVRRFPYQLLQAAATSAAGLVIVPYPRRRSRNFHPTSKARNEEQNNSRCVCVCV